MAGFCEYISNNKESRGMETIAIESIKIKRICHGHIADADDQLAVEEPMEIQVAYDSETGYVKKNISVTMCTPGNNEELAAGFLFTEGIIKSLNEIKSIKQSSAGSNAVLITLHEYARPHLQNTTRNFYTTSGCGICGKASIDAVKTVSVFSYERDDTKLNAGLFCSLPAELRKQQAMFESTGGLHASALFDFTGNFILLREDVGRHNALDKVIGNAFMNNALPLNNTVLLLSGRASFELLQKSSMAGIKIVAAMGAPSSLAAELARENNITLIGFLKKDGFNIYSGKERIIV